MKSIVAFCVLAVALVAQEPPTNILIAYDSETGNTEQLAQAIRDGAAGVEGVTVTLSKTTEVATDSIAGYDGILVGTPVEWSNMSMETKQFLDRVGEALWSADLTGDGRTAGAFCTGGGVAMGKDLARVSILAALLTMRFVVIGGVDAAGFGTLGAEATTGETDPGVSDSEEAEARAFGERFARLTSQIRAAR